MKPPILSGLSILVVAGNDSDASDVRSSLIKLGANVHVVANAHAGLMIATRKRLHGAILDCISHGASLPLCTHLSKSAVPFMFYGGVVGSSSDDAASCMVDLISVEAQRHRPELHRPSYGSGDDRHLTFFG